MTVFSFPLIFNVLAWWINNASDRYILTWISGVAASGIYAVAYKIPNILSVFQSIFYQAWSISAVKEFDRDDTDGFNGNVYTLMSFSMSAACSGLLILNVPISGFLYGDAFLDAWKYAPPLLLSVVFNAMSLFIGGIFTAVKDTKTLATTTIFGAVFNTVLNFILIPRFSAYGAAIATLAGYIAVWIMRYGILRKHIRIRVNLLREMAVSLLLIVQMVLAFRGTTYVIGQILIFLMIIWLYRSQVLTLLGSVMHHKRYNK
jgi:O-antigen/teichoic acid export membrane protein